MEQLPNFYRLVSRNWKMYGASYTVCDDVSEPNCHIVVVWEGEMSSQIIDGITTKKGPVRFQVKGRIMNGFLRGSGPFYVITTNEEIADD